MDTSYCLKCRRKTKNINSKGFVKKNKKYLVKSISILQGCSVIVGLIN